MKNLYENIAVAGFVLVAAGCLLPLFLGPADIIFKIVFTTGAAVMLAGRALQPNRETSLRAKRLVRLQVWVALFFAAAAFFMWYSADPRDWLAFTLAGGLVQTYISLTLPRARRAAK